jgi:hypothetical protein
MVIFNNKDSPFNGHDRMMGNRILKDVPSVLCVTFTLIFPPCALMMPLTTYKPIPVPKPQRLTASGSLVNILNISEVMQKTLSENVGVTARY